MPLIHLKNLGFLARCIQFASFFFGRLENTWHILTIANCSCNTSFAHFLFCVWTRPWLFEQEEVEIGISSDVVKVRIWPCQVLYRARRYVGNLSASWLTHQYTPGLLQFPNISWIKQNKHTRVLSRTGHCRTWAIEIRECVHFGLPSKETSCLWLLIEGFDKNLKKLLTPRLSKSIEHPFLRTADRSKESPLIVPFDAYS